MAQKGEPPLQKDVDFYQKSCRVWLECVEGTWHTGISVLGQRVE